MKTAIALMLASITLAIAMPHFPESDGKFMLAVILGSLITITILVISTLPGPRLKPTAWGVISTAKPTPILKG